MATYAVDHCVAEGESPILLDNIPICILNLLRDNPGHAEEDWLKTNLARSRAFSRGQRDLQAVTISS